jgi:multiple sugar transport system permease protein
MAKLTAKERAHRIVTYIFLFVFLFLSFFPVYWTVINSLKGKAELSQIPPTLFTEIPTFASFILMFVQRNFGKLILNSLIIAVVSSILCLLIAVPASYSLSRLHMPPRISKGISLWILVSKTLPPIAFVMPLFLMFSGTFILSSHLGLIIPYVAINLPFTVWIIKGVLDDFPADVEEAAMMDGNSRVVAFCKITIPNIAPALFAATILVFIACWNEFLFAVIFTNTWDTMTLPIGVWGTMSQYEFTWDKTSAAAAIAIVPVVIFSFGINKYLLKGLTMGNSK